MIISWEQDVLGPGFRSARLDLAPDRDGEICATLVHYLPQEDPRWDLPDRVVPDNLRPGGGDFGKTMTVLPPSASPQQVAELQGLPGYPKAQMLRPLVSPVDVRTNADRPGRPWDVESLRAALRTEPGGYHFETAQRWVAGAGRTTDSASDTATPPESQPQKLFSLLYIHGWNDHFFQTHLARSISHLGGEFYALDLHRYGRSFDWRNPEACFGFTRSMHDYDQDFAAALHVIKHAHPDLPLLVLGHSTGGLIATLWTARYQQHVDGLILNSAWLCNAPEDLPFGRMTSAIIASLGHMFPLRKLPQSGTNLYAHSLSGWHEDLDGPLPERLRPFRDDPAVRGWYLAEPWKFTPAAPTTFAWANAVVRGHNEIATGLQLRMPVLFLSTRTDLGADYHAEITAAEHAQAELSAQAGGEPDDAVATWSEGWRETMRHQDTVLHADLIAEAAAAHLGPHVTIRRLTGLHDLTLSQPVERAAFFATLGQWLGQNFHFVA